MPDYSKTSTLRIPLFGIACAITFLLFQASLSRAGGGPENIFLVVNSSSQASKTIANHYIGLRKIAPINIFYIKFDENNGYIESKPFKDIFLKPIFEAINRRGLASQIDYVVYSSGFPWQVAYKNEIPSDKYNMQFQPRGSLTGSTYLWSYAVQKRIEMFGFNTNFYCLPKTGDNPLKTDSSVTRAMRGQYRWLPEGTRDQKQGLPYMMSASLGVTTARGTTAEEVVQYLKVARQADGTHPKGTFYYMKHNGPRSKARHDMFPQAVNALKKEGHQAVVLEGTFPRNKPDIAGLTVGLQQYSIPDAQCKLLPGALCDNLTSSGGQFRLGVKQTALTDFLVQGAAGSCGTVVEPTAMPQKFPTPFLHLHYVRGCSMAEAFYQSIQAPFQQLVVGDPLCQPWAYFPEVTVEGLPEDKSVTGTITLTPSSKTIAGRAVIAHDFYLDGRRIHRAKPGTNFPLDTTSIPDGYHELRIVAIDNTPIETQGNWIGEIEVNNEGKSLQLTLENRHELATAKQLSIKSASEQNIDVALMHHGRKLGVIPKGNGVAKISRKSLGSGPIVLQTREIAEKGVQSAPLRFELP